MLVTSSFPLLFRQLKKAVQLRTEATHDRVMSDIASGRVPYGQQSSYQARGELMQFTICFDT
mgnify:CR=1 FL=1